jgi:hypothetical protein
MGFFGFIGDIASKIGDIAKVVAPIAAFIPGAQGIAVAAAVVSKVAPAVESVADGLERGNVDAGAVSTLSSAVTNIPKDDASAAMYLRGAQSSALAPA